MSRRHGCLISPTYVRGIDKQLETQQIADVVNQVLNHKPDAELDWEQVAEDCQRLADWSVERWGGGGDASDAQGNQMTLFMFLQRAQGRATERLSPSALIKALEAAKDRAAEHRLRRYFFPGPQWDALPDRARKRLVSAERTWFAPQGADPESVLEDLKVATESVCYELIWNPLGNWRGGRDREEFSNADRDLSKPGHHPTLRHYAQLCKQFSQKFAEPGRSLGDEKEFLADELPIALDQLNRRRNAAEHDPERRVAEQTVEAILRRFLGLGCRGILPRLAQIRASVTLAPALALLGQYNKRERRYHGR